VPRALFAIERALVDAPPARRLAVRQETSRPLVEQFFAWCLALQDTALDETPLAKAVGYATNHRTAFERFLGDGRLPMHNNWSEQQLLRQVVGRRNWIFTGSDDGEAFAVDGKEVADVGTERLESAGADLIGIALGNHEPALPVLAAVDGDEDAPGFDATQRWNLVVAAP
jgi:hypothetical protein